jgi:hypothetical protein
VACIKGETKDLAESGQRSVPGDQRTPTPGCFADVYQRKGDAGGTTPMYVNRKELGETCRRTGRELGAAGRRRNEPECSQFSIAGNLSIVK